MAVPRAPSGNGSTTLFRRKRPRTMSAAPPSARRMMVSASTFVMITAGCLLMSYIVLVGYSLGRISQSIDSPAATTAAEYHHQESRVSGGITEGWSYRRNSSSQHVWIKQRRESDQREKKIESFQFNQQKAEETLAEHGPQKVRKVLTAYVEPPLDDIIPGTGDRGDPKNDNDFGTPPEFRIPLPRRTHTPEDLKKYEYRKVKTCHDMPANFPVDRGLEFDADGNVVVWNVGNTPTPPNFAEQEAPFCPVEQDPFLPWIHDVFPSQDGSKIHFIAQNKRRCRTGTKFTENVNRLVPQVALMQSVSVQRLDESGARRLAPDLWHPLDDGEGGSPSPRYRLAPYEEASKDGMFTRFICRFHTTDFERPESPVTVLLGETLSEYPYNYELVSYRKGKSSLLSPKGKDTTLFWASNIRFDCPLPDDKDLQQTIATGGSVLSDGSATVYVDLIPIRTSVRYEELYLTEDLIGPKEDWELDAFDPVTRWGQNNVLPRVEASGRWQNIPICFPPQVVGADEEEGITSRFLPGKPSQQKPHFLSACLWASAEFKTRGKKKGASTDTMQRLEEWIEFHLMVGFDHIYVYDNSGAHTNETSLAPLLSRYPGKVTRIDWPSIVCNNNIPAHDSTGERSSQYAAENSCRTRYGPFTEWIAAFDADEYFVPMGDYTNLKDVLADAAKGGTNILSLRSSRGRLRLDKSDVVGNENAIEKSPDKTFLEAYNCDSAGSPKPSWADRARKQIYRTDYVLYHFVHYSTVTRGYLETYKEKGPEWRRHFGEHPPSERVTNELTEAVMVHTKSLGRDMTHSYKSRCRYDYAKKWQGCWVAYPWPKGADTSVKNAHDDEGMEYNCHVNYKVEDYWVPRLREALEKRRRTIFQIDS